MSGWLDVDRWDRHICIVCDDMVVEGGAYDLSLWIGHLSFVVEEVKDRWVTLLIRFIYNLQNHLR